MSSNNITGAVIIGRNEGNRLKKALQSVINRCDCIVYVDSGSTDDSVVLAKKLGVECVQLDLKIPFTAGRARNEGFLHLLNVFPKIQFVQFIDGDCEVVDGWTTTATNFLNSNQNTAIVCGRRRERFPKNSIYNQLCNIEWNTPIGLAQSCGGDFMVRVSVFKEINGFNPAVIAGEEPDMCFRIRKINWKIYRLDAEMTLHDANITKFSQWWRRCVRSGHAYAEGAFRYGNSKELFRVRECIRILVWAFVLPAGTVLSSIYSVYFIFIILIYPIQFIRIGFKTPKDSPIRWSNSFYLLLSKFPEMQGMIKFLFNRIFNATSRIIEYK